MTLWAIVPVKPLRRGKSRLANVLSVDDRALLNQTMMANTLRVLQGVKEIDQVVVISRDSAVLGLARDFNARTVQEDGRSHLNLALQRATVVAEMYGATGVLVLPADLPLLSACVVQDFIKLVKRPPSVVIAPDRRRDGTNALFISPTNLISYHYGPGSFRKHCEVAYRAGADIEIVERQELELDLDLPEDLEYLKQLDLANPIFSH
jgi:2-phospho-L-lactate/phosphoenolpyruvate guanylyltransferase